MDRESFRVDTERAVAGALILASPDVRRAALELLTDADLTDAQARFVVGVVRRMTADSIPVDPVLIVRHVHRQGLLSEGPRMSLASWLSEVTSAAPMVAALPYYCAEISDAAARDRIAAASRQVADVAVSGSVGDVRAVTEHAAAVFTAELSRLLAVVRDV